MTAIVTSYINPDLDGVACCLAIEALGTPRWTAGMLGAPDSETKLVLKTLGLAHPQAITGWTDISAIWLVDTHHPKQLPDDFPVGLVTRITDHHSGGSPECFPKAKIQNEAVGAAATLLAERFEQQGADIPPEIALLMLAAIASNTLQFNAPATSQRDHRAYEMLAGIRPIDPTLLEAMGEARRERLARTTDALLESDVKLFDTAQGLVAIAQIEAPGALDILLRDDLRSSLRHLAGSKKAIWALLNIADTQAGESAVLGTDRNLLHALAKNLGETVGDDGAIRCRRLIQRKTDIVPFITR